MNHARHNDEKYIDLCWSYYPLRNSPILIAFAGSSICKSHTSGLCTSQKWIICVTNMKHARHNDGSCRSRITHVHDTSRIQMSDVSHAHLCSELLKCASGHDMNESHHAYEWIMSNAPVSQALQICTWPYTRISHVRPPFSEVPQICIWPKREWVMAHLRMNYVMRTNESCHRYESVMSRTHLCQKLVEFAFGHDVNQR